MELLGAEVFVLTPWTAGRIVELRPVLEPIPALLAGRWVDPKAGGPFDAAQGKPGDGAGDMLEVIDDDLLGHDEVPREIIQRPLSLPKHGHNFLTPRLFHRGLAQVEPPDGVRLFTTLEKPGAAFSRARDQKWNS